jgi:probable HAF family extracellular repeat protein
VVRHNHYEFFKKGKKMKTPRTGLAIITLSSITFFLLANSNTYADALLLTPDGAGKYTIQNFSQLLGDSCRISGLNNNGQVTGYYTNQTIGCMRGFIWSNSSGFQEIQPLDTDAASMGSHINDSGQVIARSNPSGGDWGHNTRSFLWSQSGSSQDLSQSLGLGDGWASSINDSGTAIVGAFTSAGFSGNRPFVWTQTSGLQALPTLGAAGSWNAALGINNAGQIFGYCQAQVSPAYAHACFWPNPTTLIDLGALSGDSVSMPQGFNDAGQVVGWSRNFSGNPDRAFFWSIETGMTELPTLEQGAASAFGINNNGVIVGLSCSTAVMWQNDGVINLNQLLANTDTIYNLTIARSINDASQIVADGYAIPEPATLFLLAFGAVILRKRKK